MDRRVRGTFYRLNCFALSGHTGVDWLIYTGKGVFMAYPRHGVTDVVSDKVFRKHWGLLDREEDRQRSPAWSSSRAESHTVIFHDHVNVPFSNLVYKQNLKLTVEEIILFEHSSSKDHRRELIAS